MTYDKVLKSRIKELFGPQSYHRNGRLNRQYIASIVFNNKTKLEELNALVHPTVAKDGESWFNNISSPYCYALKEAALMVESGSYKSLDKLIVVTAPESSRISRVMSRDKVSEAAVRARIKNQMPEEEKLKYADFTINNDDRTGLLKQIQAIHKELVTLK
jgi:dephospho-CoA kinase